MSAPMAYSAAACGPATYDEIEHVWHAPRVGAWYADGPTIRAANPNQRRYFDMKDPEVEEIEALKDIRAEACRTVYRIANRIRGGS